MPDEEGPHSGLPEMVNTNDSVDDKAPPYEMPKHTPYSGLPEVVNTNSLADDKAPPFEVLKHSYDADEAMKAFEGSEGGAIEIDEATNRRLLRKIDLNIMPLLCVI